MNLSNRGFLNNKDTKLNAPSKLTSLNPNAAEFIPSSFRSPIGNIKSSDATSLDVPRASAKSALDRSESNVSNKSDDEAQRYWHDQLPDDITPDFKSMGENDLDNTSQLSLATLSLYDGVEPSRFHSSASNQLFGTEHDTSRHDVGNLNFGEKVGYLGSTFVEDQPSNAFMSLATTGWDKRFLNDGQRFTNGTDGNHYNGDSSVGLLSDSFSDHTVLENGAINPVEFLALQFPGFAAESLADVYYANSCDLNLTIEILTQLELQVDANFSQKTNSKSAEAPSFNTLDFPALPAADSNNCASKFNGEDLHQVSNIYRSPSSISRGSVDFASTVRKLASQDSTHRKYERSSSADGIIGSSRSSQLLNSAYNGNGKLAYGDKVRSSASRAVPLWLETGDAVANMYSDLREDARDFARLRNACFEQARQAYLIGNGALARELSRKGQLYNMQMKAAHGKAKESIYRQRNPAAPDARTQDRLIDLHGLHVTEAIQVLQHELSILRSTARLAGQRLQVMICVGTGHHTKGARTPARLPVAVEQFLLEEGIHFTQPQPGLLRVVVS
uniref:Polyadenylate-binding protein-interacting protein 7-like protein n=1 Tax=Albuca bracteata TaxID=82047 RepID=A0A0A7LUJ2_ALBBR|nr:polyadenylate-binding protein-interacting protein 7-like protein [Albuca bracteata]